MMDIDEQNDTLTVPIINHIARQLWSYHTGRTVESLTAALGRLAELEKVLPDYIKIEIEKSVPDSIRFAVTMQEKSRFSVSEMVFSVSVYPSLVSEIEIEIETEKAHDALNETVKGLVGTMLMIPVRYCKTSSKYVKSKSVKLDFAPEDMIVVTKGILKGVFGQVYAVELGLGGHQTVRFRTSQGSYSVTSDFVAFAG